MALIGTVNAPNDFGFKNRIINGAMVNDQRNGGASISVAAATPSTYFPVDRFFCQSTGTAFTAQRVAGSGSFKNALRLTGAASNTNAYTTQRIESLNTYDLVSQSVTLSAVLSRSSGSTCTWTAYFANTVDAHSSGVTVIATGTFSLTTTPTTYSATFNAGASAGNGIMIEFAWGALGSGVTVDITGVQLEKGSVATSFEYRPYSTELQLCQRYFWNAGLDGGSIYWWAHPIEGTTTYRRLTVTFPVNMRTAPTSTVAALSNGSFGGGMPNVGINGTQSCIISCDVTATNQYGYITNFTATAEL
jgi:hypothetical protein